MTTHADRLPEWKKKIGVCPYDKNIHSTIKSMRKPLRDKKQKTLSIDAISKIMMTKEAVASCALDGCTQCGTIEPDTFNLSEKIQTEGSNTWGCKYGYIDADDVKDFVRKQMWLIMKYFQSTTDGKVVFLGDKYSDFIEEFKALAGDKLI